MPALPAFITETPIGEIPDSRTPLLAVVYTQDGQRKNQIFDFNSHEARQAHMRFVSWALRNGIKFESKPVEL
jgi:hypothetical protein